MSRYFQILRILALGAALLASVLAARSLVDFVERRSETEVREALGRAGLDGVEVATDGLRLLLIGQVESESDRFQAVAAASLAVDPDRIIDDLVAARPEEPETVGYSLEILRNTDGISLIGLVPEGDTRERVLNGLQDYAALGDVTDVTDTASYPMPESWPRALDFGIEALRALPRSKISITAESVEITAIAASSSERSRIETQLRNGAPEGVAVMLDISAPRPVVTPFTLRFVLSPERVGFDACTADSEVARVRILKAAEEAGMTDEVNCQIALGVPSATWSQAVAVSLRSLQRIGGGSVSFSDADITLVGPAGLERAAFDTEMAELEAALPELFSLHAVLPPPEDAPEADVAPRFTSTLSPEGLVQLRGYVADEARKEATASFAKALFGASNVYAATRVNQTVPEGWSVRVLAGLEALSKLNRGSLVVEADALSLSGATGDPEGAAVVTQVFSARLASAEDLRLAIRYDEALDPEALKPTAEECVEEVTTELARKKITFDPGSATIASDAEDVLDRIAELLAECPDVALEIAGHTDSQGREQMNLNLSQARAEAVLTALMDRRVLTSRMVAKGYGEAAPIADNKTDDGREANRRIEFTLLDGEIEGVEETASSGEDAVSEEESPDE